MPLSQQAKQPTSQQANHPHVYLLSDVNVVPSQDGNAPRKFNGIANSGKPFNHYGERVIVDLANIRYHDKIPALVEHERSKRAGFGVLSVKNNQLMISGTLLDNEFGNEVASDADAGFPWQMSAHVIADINRVLSGDETAIINGQTVKAPIKILQNCRVPEVSFTPTGVDDQTSAVVLSDSTVNNSPDTSQAPIDNLTPNQKDIPMSIEKLKAELAKMQARIDELEKINQELQDSNSELAKQATKANVDAQLSQAGFKHKEAGEGWESISDATYQVLLSQDADKAKAMIADLTSGQTAPTADDVPDYLLGEQYPSVSGTTATGNSHASTTNVLLANAKARSDNKPTYI